MQTKNLFYLILCFCCMLHSSLNAQIYLGFLDLSSLTVSSEAADVAMGESYTAYPYGISAFTHNPATLMGTSGANLFYFYRDNEAIDFLDQSQYNTYGASISTSLGNFGVSYQKFSLGRITVTTITNLAGYSQVEFIDETLDLAFSRNFTDQLTLGLGAKWYDGQINNLSGTPLDMSTHGAIIFDIGALYWIPGFVATREVSDHFFFGASFQNFGTDFDYRLEDVPDYTAVQLPRFFRLGFTYRLHAQDPGSGFSFKYFLTGEYRRLLNPSDAYNKANCDFGGIGFKAMFFDIFSLEIGGYYNSVPSFTTDEDRFNIRYGFNVDLALKQFGADYPVTVTFQFAHIPVSNYLEPLFSEGSKNLPVFSIRLAYTDSIF